MSGHKFRVVTQVLRGAVVIAFDGGIARLLRKGS